MKISRRNLFALPGILACLFFLSCPAILAQQKTVALIEADKNRSTREFALTLESALGNSFKFSDRELTAQAIHSASDVNLFNLTLESARNIGAGIGCDFYFILRSENLRRSSSKKDKYYEAYVVLFFVDARTGNLLGWKHLSTEADEAVSADTSLTVLFKNFVPELTGILKAAAVRERAAVFDTTIYEIDGGSGQTLRTPLPFQRFSPASTPLAQQLRVEAVVDIEVAIDAKGYITATRIMRWAGFGLDEAVTETVKKMNFRPAILDEKPIPARFLLRYNFRVPPDNKRP
jgi:TonB family protein